MESWCRPLLPVTLSITFDLDHSRLMMQFAASNYRPDSDQVIFASRFMNFEENNFSHQTRFEVTMFAILA